MQAVQPAMWVRPPDISMTFNTCVREHLETDRASHIFKDLESSSAIIDQASSRLALNINSKRRYTYVLWDKPTPNPQVKHANLKLSV